MSFSDVQTVDLLYFYVLTFFAENKKKHLAACNQYPLLSAPGS